MPPSLGYPTRRITLVLREANVIQLERRYGRGWTEQVRRMVEENCRAYHKTKRTLEDLMQGEPDAD